MEPGMSAARRHVLILVLLPLTGVLIVAVQGWVGPHDVP
jgi:hypothetical protein